MPAKLKPLYGYTPVRSRKNLPQYLYHATKTDYLESIKDFGLIKGLIKGVPGWKKDPDFLWLDSKPQGLRKWLKKYYPDWDWSIVRINTDYLDLSKLYKKKLEKNIWYVYRGDIPPEALYTKSRYK